MSVYIFILRCVYVRASLLLNNVFNFNFLWVINEISVLNSAQGGVVAISVRA